MLTLSRFIILERRREGPVASFAAGLSVVGAVVVVLVVVVVMRISQLRPMKFFSHEHRKLPSSSLMLTHLAPF